jgi:hypothetical protein
MSEPSNLTHTKAISMSAIELQNTQMALRQLWNSNLIKENRDVWALWKFAERAMAQFDGRSPTI